MQRVVPCRTNRKTDMFRIVSLNLNGIRSAANKGFFDWLAQHHADVVCLQEIKAQEADLSPAMLQPHGYHGYFHCAEKKGYSGVAIYTRRKPENVIVGMNDDEFDREGRYLEVDLGNLTVVSLYLPSGSSSPERQEAKFRFLERFLPHLQALAASGREIVLCGDWNIAHKPIDLKNWRPTRRIPASCPRSAPGSISCSTKSAGSTRSARLNQEPDQYTWWSNRGQAWAKNVGWRIDYQIATPGIADKARHAEIYLAQRFSDHAPLRRNSATQRSTTRTSWCPI
jgi:exodeoxyribonuclease-3